MKIKSAAPLFLGPLTRHTLSQSGNGNACTALKGKNDHGSRCCCRLKDSLPITDICSHLRPNCSWCTEYCDALISHFPKQTNSPTSSVPILAVELTFVPHMSALSDYFKDLRPPVTKVCIHVNVCTRQGLILLRKKFLQTANFP